MCSIMRRAVKNNFINVCAGVINVCAGVCFRLVSTASAFDVFFWD